MPTPNIDELSAGGIRMERYYTHTVCTPSRMSLLTGKYSHLSGFGSGGILLGPAPYSLPENTTTLPKELRARGYAAHAVGKWHLGSTRFKDTPVGRSWGFESFVGLLHGAGGHYSKTVSGPEGIPFYDYARAFDNGTWLSVHDDRHSTKCLTEEAINIINTHAEERPSQPLFLYLAYTAGHTPLQADPEWMSRCRHFNHTTRRSYCGLIAGADEGIGNVTAAARRVLGEDVILLVTTDNGGMLHVGGNNQPLRGGKNTGFEGGVRAVGFVADLSPDARHLPRGRVFSGLAHIADWMPTLLGIADNATATTPSHTPAAPPPATPAVPLVPEATPPPPDALPASSGATPSPSPPLGHGFDLGPALRVGGDASPRPDAVLVLDEWSNFVSYLRPPYKLLLGHAGDGEWSSEPQGRYLYGPHTSLLDVAEEELSAALDYALGTRDLSFFWHEVVHLLAGTAKKAAHRLGDRLAGREPSPSDYDFYNAGRPVLGTASGGDVLASPELRRQDIPVMVFDVYGDPSESRDLAATRPELVSELVAAFNVHWSARPLLFDWSLSCVNATRLRPMPRALCEARSSHLFPDMDRRSVSITGPCEFEAPYIPDDAVGPCGDGKPGPINLKQKFKDRIRSILLRGLGSTIAIIVVFRFVFKFLFRSFKK